VGQHLSIINEQKARKSLTKYIKMFMTVLKSKSFKREYKIHCNFLSFQKTGKNSTKQVG
jgi:hypothetical protein